MKRMKRILKNIFLSLFCFTIWSNWASVSKLLHPKPVNLVTVPKDPPRVKNIDATAPQTNFAGKESTSPLTREGASLAGLPQSREMLQKTAATLVYSHNFAERYSGSNFLARPATNAKYWQIGCGPFSVGRIYQDGNRFVIFGAGVSSPVCSFQEGTYTTRELIESSVSLSGTIGGGSVPVINTSFASYGRTGFHHCISDGLKIESIGRGTPQGEVGATLILQTYINPA